MRNRALMAGLILAVGAVVAFRLVRLDLSPPGFYADEASIGYNAFSILRTGRDEHGRLFPLYFEAFGEFKNPIFIYAAVPAVAMLGPQPVALRTVAAVFGLGVCILVALGVLILTADRRWAVAGFVIAGLIPWLVLPGRVAFEAISLPFFLMLGWLFWIRAIEKGGWIWFILSGLAHAFAFYAYSTGRAVAPLHLIILVLTFRGHGPAGWVRAGAAAAFVVALLPALIWSMANPGSLGSRFADVSVLSEAGPFRAGIRFVLNLIRYVSPGFLFTDGDPILRHHSGTGGVLYLFLIPGLVFGILSAIRRGSDPRLRSIFYICLLFPLVPSLTHRSFHLLRSIHAAPFFVLLAVIGSRELFSGRAGEERAPGGKPAWLLVLVLASAGLEAPTYVYELFKKYPARAEIFFQAHVGEVIEAVRAGHDGPIYYDPTVFRDESGKSNRPEIHFLFWGGLDPETYHEGGIEEFDIRRWTRGTVVDPGSRVILGEGREEAEWSLTGSFPLAKGTGRQARIYQVPQE